jgi:hypothetical protein
MASEESTDWVSLGRDSYGLIEDDRIVAIVYWTPAGAGESLEPGAGPDVLDAGYYVVDVNRPWDHECIVEGAKHDWERVCQSASQEFFNQRARREPGG